MAVFSKKILSGSTNGKSIAVAATATPGTLIHTGSTDPLVLQEIWIYATNYDTVSHRLNIEFGGTTAADNISLLLDPYTGLSIIIPGLNLVGNATPLVVRAFADTASKIAINGYVNEIA